MVGNELYLVAGMAALGALLWWRYVRTGSRRSELADARGLDYHERGLAHLPGEFMRSILFTLADGGHESHVARGEVDLGGHVVGHSVFELRLQRSVRGEWAYLTTQPSFRIHSPVTVLAYTLPCDVPHTLIKRHGPSMLVAEGELEAFTSLAGMARDMSGIERAVAVAPPAGMAPAALGFEGLAGQYAVWSADEGAARRLLSHDVQQLLTSKAAGTRDLAIEVLGPLLLLYCTSDGRLARQDALDASRFADELCRKLIATTTES